MSEPSPAAAAARPAESPAPEVEAPNASTEPENTNLFLEHQSHEEIADSSVAAAPVEDAAGSAAAASNSVEATASMSVIATDEDAEDGGSEKKKPRYETDYDTELMDLNDTEQLQFLADQLKPTGGSDAFGSDQAQHAHHPGSHDLTMSDHGLDHSGHGHHHHLGSGMHVSTNVSTAPILATASTAGSSMGSLTTTGGAYSTTISPTSYADLPAVDPKITDPLYVLRVKSLPILDNLSTQILNTLGRGAYMDAIAVATQPDTDQGQAFQILMSLFEQTKSIYSEDAFLSARELQLNKTREYSIIIQKTNLATFVSAVFGAAKVGFFHLNENFLDTFVVDNGRLLKPQGALFLDLKTQAYISAMGQVERSQREILDDLFPEDIDRILLARRQSTKVLAPSEADFVARCRRRREHLAAVDPETEDISLKYSWLAFVRDLSEYISKNSQMILTGKSAKAAAAAQKQQGDYEGGRGLNGNGKRSRGINSGNDDLHRRMSGISMENGGDAGSDTALLDSAGDATGRDDHRIHGGSQSPNAGASQSGVMGSAVGANSSVAPVNVQPASTGTATPTGAATISSGPATRAPFYQRRPWTSEEEEALMSGLNAVQGPHWSQILELYGAGGRISEVLKDRNQVQLKDKARNLKLFFLKTGVQMPDVLRFVTGDVKSRDKSAAAAAAAAAAGGGAKRGRKGAVSKSQQQKAQAKQYQMYRAQQRFQQQHQQHQHQEQQQQQQQQQQLHHYSYQSQPAMPSNYAYTLDSLPGNDYVPISHGSSAYQHYHSQSQQQVPQHQQPSLLPSYTSLEYNTSGSMNSSISGSSSYQLPMGSSTSSLGSIFANQKGGTSIYQQNMNLNSQPQNNQSPLFTSSLRPQLSPQSTDLYTQKQVDVIDFLEQGSNGNGYIFA